MNRPLIIAHRGASGYLPEHTLAAYELAIDQGADFVEPDLVMTRDGVLIARHENLLERTTDVTLHPEFLERYTGREIEGKFKMGWFSEDFTLAEIRRLRAIEPNPTLRPDSTRADCREPIPTLAEILDLVARKSAEVGRPIGIYPEIKHPAYFRGLGLPMEETLVGQLRQAGYHGADAPVYIQCFEVGPLQRLRHLTDLPLAQIIGAVGGPFDLREQGTTWKDMATASGLAAIAGYAQAVVPDKYHHVLRLERGRVGRPEASAFVAAAHAHGLQVHPYAFRRENAFLPLDLRKGDNSADAGNLRTELELFAAVGVDGWFVDNPDIAAGCRAAMAQR